MKYEQVSISKRNKEREKEKEAVENLWQTARGTKTEFINTENQITQ